MIELPLFKELILIFLISLVIILIFHKVNIPTVVGLLTAGILIGPSALGIVQDKEMVATLTEIGLIPLLFLVGIEFPLTELKRLKNVVLLSGGFQIAVTSIVFGTIVFSMGIPPVESILFGFVAALSSTALMLKILTDRAEVTSPQGKVIIGILLAQDVFAILLMFLLPIFGEMGSQGVGFIRLITRFGLAFSIVFILFFLSKWLLPRSFHLIAGLKDREVFTMSVFIFILGIVWIANEVGISIALGAFLAGIIISEQEIFKHHVTAQILPFKDLLSSLFFISIGMLLDLAFIREHLPAVLILTMSVVILKSLTGIISTLILRYPIRIAIMAGLGLSQLGEFSFLLANAGLVLGLISKDYFQMIIAVTIFTLFITPFLVRVSSPLGYAFSRLESPGSEKIPPLKHHTVIMGYGLNGRNLARVLRSVGIDHIIVDLNPGSVKEGKKKGDNIIFGDATQREVLKRVGIERARICVIAISDRIAAERALTMVKHLNPGLKVVVRTRYVADIEKLFTLGADQVIPEEFETSVEIFIRTLKEYRVPGNIIASQVAFIREEGYKVLREGPGRRTNLERFMVFLKESATATFIIEESSRVAEKTLAEVDIRGKAGASVLAVIRHNKSFVNPGSNFTLKAGDVLVLLGNHEQLDNTINLLA